jgi:hypothetical protein
MSPVSHLEPDLRQLARFVAALFAHAGEGGIVHLRAFFDDELAKRRGDRPFAVRRVKLNGRGLGDLVEAAAALALEASRAERPIVLAPPICTFNGGKPMRRASARAWSSQSSSTTGRPRASRPSAPSSARRPSSWRAAASPSTPGSGEVTPGSTSTTG